MGRVWRAIDTHSGQLVALKELSALTESVARERFVREATLLSSVNHPGVVRYVGHGTWQSMIYLVMEWLDGKTLWQCMSPPRVLPKAVDPYGATAVASLPAHIENTPTEKKASNSRYRNAPLPIARVVAMGARLAAGVAELHRHGIIHRDIKPSNLFLVNADLSQVKLIDLGVARSVYSGGRTITHSGVTLGTPHFMAPEQARAGGAITTAADVWGIGCVLYQCLAGVRPFDGANLVDLFTHICLHEPIDVRRWRPEIPPQLAEVVMQTLRKAPGERPTAVQLAAKLDHLNSVYRFDGESIAGHAAALLRREPVPETIADVERRVWCALVVRGGSESGEDLAQMTIAELGECLIIRDLVGGMRLVTFDHSSVLSDQASRAARAALTLRKQTPGAAMAMVMCNASEAALPFSSAIQSSAARLRSVPPGTILLDETSTSLLESRFTVIRGRLGPVLLTERTRETTRTVLGQHSPWVGRRREITWLISSLEECVEDNVARAVLIAGPAGMGKSRLWQEFLDRVEHSGQQYQVLCGHGDALRTNSPFAVLAAIVTTWAELDAHDSPELQWDALQARLAEFISGEKLDRFTVGLSAILGASGPKRDHPIFAAVRENPVFLRELMQEAWLGWARALCARSPVLLILDDLHWADPFSVNYVDLMLKELHDLPVMVLALTRPDIEQRFPRLWAERGLSEFPLHPLSATACARFARSLLDADTDADVIDRVVKRSGGNAFCLEELVRAVAVDDAELPDTVLGMVHSRLDSLGAQAKRILCAASVFGSEFSARGVSALVGDWLDHFHIDEWLGMLVREEVLEPMAAERHEYVFRHILMRDAAYALLTDGDRTLAHYRAGAWLAETGEPSPLVLAEHFIRGNCRERAASYLVEAADVALKAGDLAGTLEHGERAIEFGASGELRGRARAFMSIASDWQGEYLKSQEHGLAALDELEPGGGLWFTALGSALMSSARISDRTQVAELIERLHGTGVTKGAEKERLSCLCRVGFGMMIWADAEALSSIRREIDAAVECFGDLPPQLEAQYQEFEGWNSAMTGDVVGALNHFSDSAAAYEESGMKHNAVNVSGQMGYMHNTLGEFERTRELCESLVDKCEPSNHLTRRYLQLSISVARCRSQSVPSDQAVDALYEVIEEYRQTGSQALLAAVWTYTAEAEYARSNFTAARSLAQKACEVHDGGRMGPWVSAVYALALAGCGELDHAREQADRAMAQKSEFGGTLEGHLTVHWAQVEVREALGDREGAALALRSALDELNRMTELAGTERGPSLLRLRDSQRFLHLAEEWGIEHTIGI
ncbi:MAG: protein kinase [Proteobacteria bacterium]|nr:protein kinase [Pseudomonadota bacterium]